MVSYVDFIEERSPQIIVEYRARLEEKLRELLADNQLDDSRIAQEVTIFADKICVDEETVGAQKPYPFHEGFAKCRWQCGKKA